MTISILNTKDGLEAVLKASEAERTEALRSVLTPMEGMFRYFPGEVDLLMMHSMSFGFPLDLPGEEAQQALDLLSDADAWGRVETAVSEAVEQQLAATPGIDIPDIKVLIMLGNPNDEYFMGPLRGFSGNGSATGYISLTLWPTEENLNRIEAGAVHELNHNLRYAPGGVIWDPAQVAVGEQIISEGLADAFARQLYGHTGYTPIGLPHLHDDRVFEKVVTGLQVRGMQNFTAWVHGDESARRFGCDPVGLPTGAGYAAGNRLVDAYLQAAGITAAQALHTSSQEIIDVALGVLR
ncbi:DUF2268 domain-containing protein [Paenarthrobacter nicotinovorans]|uniref:DUF2268 domain-containing protein n=1 Tax=Paenarthrobacter nicotinovorans TaxID=29320 RepID=UPI00047CBA13|nr:DUF2268 domain-containing putative Zn-dependent protease [Paenarthrobacter nicotinovorans]